MNILQINNVDLVGRRFNGYDLNIALRGQGHNASMLVTQKQSTDDTVHPLFSVHEAWIHSRLTEECRRVGADGIWGFAGQRLAEHPAFAAADLTHYHLIHNMPLSFTDFPQITMKKPSIWTIHDIWPVTGGCIHPFDCKNWETDCTNCPRSEPGLMRIQPSRAAEMFRLKREMWRRLDLDLVVASSFTQRYLEESPILPPVRVHRIPFGIHEEAFSRFSREDARETLKISPDEHVLAFRYQSNDEHTIKGCRQLLDMLERLPTGRKICILTCGVGSLPDWVGNKFHLVELGWKNDLDIMARFYAACDIFLMPSLAESFGLMAIEAMASARPVVVFENTVLPEITFAPKCGVAVPYCDSEALATAVLRLLANPDECRKRGELGRELTVKHYRFADYVRRHLELYEEVIGRNRHA